MKRMLATFFFQLLFVIVTHAIVAKLYMTYCVATHWFPFFHSMIMFANPQCKLMLNILQYTSDIQIAYWSGLVTFIMAMQTKFSKRIFFSFDNTTHIQHHH